MNKIIGYSPEITAMLESLRTRIGVMLDYPTPMVEMSQKEIQDYDRRFDIIIGNVGLKDLSKEAIQLNPEQSLKFAQSLLGPIPEIPERLEHAIKGIDKWPNTAPSSPATPSESPERVETAEEAFKAWRRAYKGPGWSGKLLEDCFRAGYEAGRKAK